VSAIAEAVPAVDAGSSVELRQLVVVRNHLRTRTLLGRALRTSMRAG
jgi:hypothetical protein